MGTVIFIHEYAGDYRAGSRKYATFQDAIAASHITRGYPPSDVPENPEI